MTRGASVLAQLARGRSVDERVVIVTAHPDDETVSMGGALCLLPHATIVQVTDGAINDPDAWRKAGVASRAAYAALRQEERVAAFTAAEWDLPWIGLGLMDQATTPQLETLPGLLTLALAYADVVVTHPYEGGHLDHDSAAFAVQQACLTMAHPPDRLEFASYHWDGRRRVTGRFWPPTETVTGVILSGEVLARKQRALAAYTSQQSVIRWFNPAVECYRIAPIYDFSQPPPPPACLYDRKAWQTTSAQWRTAAVAAMARQAVPA